MKQIYNTVLHEVSGWISEYRVVLHISQRRLEFYGTNSDLLETTNRLHSYAGTNIRTFEQAIGSCLCSTSVSPQYTLGTDLSPIWRSPLVFRTVSGLQIGTPLPSLADGFANTSKYPEIRRLPAQLTVNTANTLNTSVIPWPWELLRRTLALYNGKIRQHNNTQ